MPKKLKGKGSAVDSKVLDMINRIKIVQPGPFARQLLGEHKSKRSMPMDYLKNKDGFCAWCEVGRLPSRRHKYCQRDCNQSAMIFCYPQSLDSRGFHLIEYQAGSCRGCGEYYGDRMFEIIIRRLGRWKKYDTLQYKLSPNKVCYHFAVDGLVGLEVDHIQPIFKGGWGIGLTNIQVLCSQCHRLKSGRERQK